MINYTERLTLLMHDIVTRVPTLSFINIADVLVFARAGRSNAEGAFATCHCLTLPPREPGYYFWRDRATKAITRRSEWFVTKSPVVTVGTRPIKYLISFALPRFCDQSLEQVAAMVHAYLATKPSANVFDFLRDDFAALENRHGGVIGASFRTFP